MVLTKCVTTLVRTRTHIALYIVHVFGDVNKQDRNETSISETGLAFWLAPPWAEILNSNTNSEQAASAT